MGSVTRGSSNTQEERSSASASATAKEQVSRVSFHPTKDFPTDIKTKSLDENGNAVNRLESSQSNERKSKTRRAKTNNESNFIMSHNIEGYRGDKDLDTLIKFIESDTESKGKTKSSTHSNGPLNFNNKQQRNNPRKEDIVSGAKPKKEQKGGSSASSGGGGPDEEEERPSRSSRSSKQIPKEHRNGPTLEKGDEAKLKKSNSMEEISNWRTVTPEVGSLPSETVVTQRRIKKQSMPDGDIYSHGTVGERRSWGSEEQHYTSNDSTAVGSSEDNSNLPLSACRKRRSLLNEERRRPERDATPIPATGASGTSEESGFCVIETKKQRRKKRRSSSGVRGSMSSSAGFLVDDGKRSGGGQYNQSQYSGIYQGNRDIAYHQKKNCGGSGFPPHDRTPDNGGGGSLYQYRHHRSRSPDHCRRKSTSSVPPSDKSDSSDLDSVHSLPVSSTTSRPALDQTSTSSGSTPQASYADIAKMASVNVPTTQGAYGNVGFGTKWPAVSIPKGVVISPPTSSSTITPSSNPQFITGPKVNIGAPPVSGSKVANNPASPNSNCSSVTSSQSSANPPVPTSSVSGDDTSPASSVNQDTEPVHLEISSKSPNTVTDPRTKKDAMTNTTIDFKLIPPYTNEESDLNSKPHSKQTEPPVNMLLDSDYPPLEESLASDKSDRKVGKVPVHQSSPQSSLPTCNFELLVQGQQAGPALNNPLPNQLPAVPQEVKVQNTNTPSVHNSNPNRNRSSSPVPCSEPGASSHEVSRVLTMYSVNPLHIQASGLPTPNHDPSPVASSVGHPTTCAPLMKTKSSSRKTSSVGCQRPPVIMNDDKGGSSYGDAAPVELTFGFEVNEQLLLSDGDDVSVASPSQDSSSPQPEHTSHSSEEMLVGSARAALMVDKIARVSNAGEDFSARFREPAVQAGNYDKIVDFVGLAWDDVLKEMSTAQVHSGAKIQYYSGQ